MPINLTRRSFLGLGLATGVATIIKPTYFFAPVKGWYNSLDTCHIISPAGKCISYEELAYMSPQFAALMAPGLHLIYTDLLLHERDSHEWRRIYAAK
jgi:hypothetical protein